MTLAGRCHCGNLTLEFETALDPSALPLRACQCSFCRAHGALSTSDPAGRVSVSAGDASMVQKYRFGLRITDFILCRRCGVYLLAVAEMGGVRYAVLNANALDERARLTSPPQPMDYGGEDAASRRARRAARWTPVARLQGLS
ncbi:MAG TPA: aldehyde-activating protein [Gammaproteobacteria bacterium]|nr:aldehyde-activating protein [Gammaproteobacteria bacterium]